MSKKADQPTADPSKAKKLGFFRTQLAEFKEFALKSSVMDLAIGVVIGGAFSNIITSLVDYIIMPLLGLIMGGVNLSNLSLTLNDSTLKYGAFLQSIIDFLLIAFCVFFFIRLVNAMKKKILPAPPSQPTPSETYLREIRDLLQAQSRRQNDK